jgi:hypothetical protein
MKTNNTTLCTLFLGLALIFSAYSSGDDINPTQSTQTSPMPNTPDVSNAVLATYFLL